MEMRKLVFSKRQKSQSLFLSEGEDLVTGLFALGLPSPVPVIVLVGGAGKIAHTEMPLIHKITSIVAKAAEGMQAIILDGGTNAGVMESMGQARKEGKYRFPLVGIAADRLVLWPGKSNEATNLAAREQAPLDPNHSHFILVPGETWGDESSWISKAASLLSGNKPSITVLINGGDISRMDVENSIKANRSILVIQGTGRLADEMANEKFDVDLVEFVSAFDLSIIKEKLYSYLIYQEG